MRLTILGVHYNACSASVLSDYPSMIKIQVRAVRTIIEGLFMTSSTAKYSELLVLIAKHQVRHGITDQQFAHILGYERVQTFTMTRDGMTKYSS